LDNDEEEVEDLRVIEKIEEILRDTYERKTRVQGSGEKEGSPFHILISVEPTTPCVTKTSKEEKLVNQQVIRGRRTFTGHGSSGKSSRRVSSKSSSQLSTPCGGGSKTNFTMEGQDSTIRLPEF
jgi:hypothetical protein